MKLYEVLPINKNTLNLIENRHWRKVCKTAILTTRFNITTQKVEKQHYISTKTISARKACKLISEHWNIENRLHQNLDRAFVEDTDKSYKKPNLKAMLRSIALNILHHNKVEEFTQTIFRNSLNIKNILNLKGFCK